MMRVLLLLPLLTACGAFVVTPETARDEARRINALDTATLWRV